MSIRFSNTEGQGSKQRTGEGAQDHFTTASHDSTGTYLSLDNSGTTYGTTSSKLLTAPYHHDLIIVDTQKLLHTDRNWF